MLSKDYPAESKRRFADRHGEGASITVLQHEFGLSKSTVKLRRERIDQGGAEAAGRPGKSRRYSQELKLDAVDAFLRGEGGYGSPAIEHGVRNGAQVRDWARRCREGGGDAPALGSPGRKKAAPAADETLERRCARLETEAEISRRMAASATALSAAGGSTRQ